MRITSQWISFVLCILIMTFSLWSAKVYRYKLYSNLMWFLFGLVGALFYADVLVIDWINIDPVSGSDLSAIRAVIQYTMVVSWLFLWLLRDLRRRK
jgi:hypothetical protein